MTGVLDLLRRRVTDRGEMARRLGVTRAQVTSALRNLQFRGLVQPYQHGSGGYRKGRGETIYKPVDADWSPAPRRSSNPLIGTPFVFWPRNHTK